MFKDPREVLQLIRPTDRVLDVGGAIETFPRADAVIDVLPYDDRRPGPLQEMPERFGRAQWHVGDICTPEIWRGFADDEFDFVVCSHTLEDVRDPIVVCEQMNRVGKAGYIETPSRFRECARASADDRYPGWEHHRWLVDVVDGCLIFTAKMVWAMLFDFLGDDRREHVANYWNQFTAVHWTGSFDYVEHMAKGSVLEVENLVHFFDTYPYDDPPACFHRIDNVPHRGRTLKSVDEFKLPIERVVDIHEIIERHRQRTAGV